MMKMTATCLIILVLATVGQAGTFANCVAGHWFALMDDPTEFVTDLSHFLHTSMSNDDAEDLVTALAEMDCSAVEAILPTTSQNSADWADIFHVAMMEEIHSFESAVSATKNRRELAVPAPIFPPGMHPQMSVATMFVVAVVSFFFIPMFIALAIIEATQPKTMSAEMAASVVSNMASFVAQMAEQGVEVTDSRLLNFIESAGRRALSTEDNHRIITAADVMAGCANVGELSDVCRVPIGDLAVDFSTALCGGASGALECDFSLATLIGVIDQAQAPQGRRVLKVQ